LIWVCCKVEVVAVDEGRKWEEVGDGRVKLMGKAG
jgi:hypothetical protein